MPLVRCRQGRLQRSVSNQYGVNPIPAFPCEGKGNLMEAGSNEEDQMSELSTVDEILDYAIRMEQAAVDLYTDLANKVTSEATRATFLEYANEERGHKAKLQRVKGGKKLIKADQKIQDLKISDYTNDVVLDDNPSYQDVLLFAIKQEKQAYRLYMDLAAVTDDAELKETMIGLANEEAKHKLRFEIEYDDHVLVEN